MVSGSRSLDPALIGPMLDRFDRVSGPLAQAATDETGFTARDSADLVSAARSVLVHAMDPGFEAGPLFQPKTTLDGRKVKVEARPIGQVAVVLPQNAFPYMALLSGLSAIAAGNKVWLRAPSRCGASLALVQEVFGDAFAGRLAFSSLSGREFAEWAVAEPEIGMLHFIGGSRTAAGYLQDAFDSGTELLVDGDGNCQVYVGASFDPTEAVRILTTAATRFNGQTCTSTVGAVVHPSVAEAVKAGLVASFSGLVTGDPHDPATDVGTLFSSTGVQDTIATVEASGGKVLCGGPVGAAVKPMVVESPDPESELVREGVFAPVLWTATGGWDAFAQVWTSNRYPLCAGVLSRDDDDVRRTGSLPRLSRLTVNGDTSDEDPLEPWGACPSSGNGRVEPWVARYLRTVQFDLPEGG